MKRGYLSVILWGGSTTSARIKAKSATFALATAAFCAAGVSGQEASYSFTSGASPGDGFAWPASPTGLLDGDSFDAPENLGGTNTFYNYIGNNLFFDDNYQVAGNSPLITDEACWGNPTDFGCCFEFDFYNSDAGFAQTVQFNFAWATAGSDAPIILEIYIDDVDGDYAFVSEILDTTYTGFGGFEGQAGTILLDASQLLDDLNNPLDGIAYVYIDLYEISDEGGTSEFAIDNFIVDGTGGGGEDSDVHPDPPSLIGVGSNTLKQPGTYSLGFDVQNTGTGATTYSATVSGANWTDPGGQSGVPINPGELIFYGAYGNIDRNLPSGFYPGTITLSNDLNLADSDEIIDLGFSIYDPPILTDDSGSTVDLGVDNQIFISNAAAGPHGGALRAGVEITGTTTTGPFSVSGMVIDDFVGPGDTLNGTVGFALGTLSGTHNGSFTTDLEMNSAPGSFLNGDPPVPPIVWSLTGTLNDTRSANAAFGSGEPFGPGVIGVNNDKTAGTILDGTASGATDVDMSILPPWSLAGGGATGVVTDSVEVLFSAGSDLYVLQLTYREAELCPEIPEADLRLLWYDNGLADWAIAVDGNSDSGTGASFLAGSYESYLAGIGGGPPVLSVHGVDEAANTVWAVIDHASVFGAGKIGAFCAPCPADSNGDGMVNVTDLLALLAAWGPCPGCPEDTNDDDVVNVTDLLALLAAWGPC